MESVKINTYFALLNELCLQDGLTSLHICAMYGYEYLLDCLCEKYGADPTVATPVR